MFQSLSNTLALIITDDSHQGRVQSLMQLSFAGFGLAAAPLGLLAEAIGLRGAIVVMGTVTMAAVIVYTVLEGGLAMIRPDTEPDTVTPETPGRRALLNPGQSR